MNKTKLIITIAGVAMFMAVAQFASAKVDLQPAGADKPASLNTLTYNNNVVWKGNVRVNKVLTVGKKSNKGKLYIKGVIQNPLSGKSVVVKDNFKVQGNLTVTGNLNLKDRTIQGADIAYTAIKEENLADGAITSVKIADDTISQDDLNFLSQGFLKAAVFVDVHDNVIRSFNPLGGTVTITKNATGEYYVNLGFDVSERFVNVNVIGGQGYAIPDNYAGTIPEGANRVAVATFTQDTHIAANRAFMLLVY